MLVAAQDSSLVTVSLSEWLFYLRVIRALQGCRRHLWLFWQLMKRMRRNGRIKQEDKDKDKDSGLIKMCFFVFMWITPITSLGSRNAFFVFLIDKLLLFTFWSFVTYSKVPRWSMQKKRQNWQAKSLKYQLCDKGLRHARAKQEPYFVLFCKFPGHGSLWQLIDSKAFAGAILYSHFLTHTM